MKICRIMYLFPHTIFLMVGKSADLYNYMHAGEFYQDDWFLKITDISVKGEANKLSGKRFHLRLASNFCQEDLLDQNRNVLVRNQNLAVISGRFPLASEDSDLTKVEKTFRFEDPSFHLVNKPSDILQLLVHSLDESGASIEDLNFFVRLVLFKVRSSD